MGSVPPSELLTGAELLQPIGLAMFKSSIMILLLAVLTVQVVQTAGARKVPAAYEDLILHRHRILVACEHNKHRPECRLTHASATGGTSKEIGRGGTAIPSSGCCGRDSCTTRWGRCVCRNKKPFSDGRW